MQLRSPSISRATRRPRPVLGRLAVAVAVALAWPLLGAASGCATTSFWEREHLADRCLRYDQDRGLTYIRNKTEAAREGAFGGFGGASAGGCGCQ